MQLLNSKKKVFLIASFINIITLILCLWVNDWKYESCDDYFMHSVLTGAYGGKYDVHLYFVNAFYAYFLKPFYIILPNIGWYSIFEAIAVLSSFVSVSYLLIHKWGSKIGAILSLLFLSCISLDFYLHIEFTKCAAATMAAGILFFAFGNKERNLRYLVLGSIFMMAGFVFRKEMFLLGLPPLFVLLLYWLLSKRALWKGTLFAIAALVLAVFCFKTFDSSLYKAGDYEYYAAYQKPRAFFGDGNFFDAKAFSDELDERGIGSRNYRYLRAWYFFDNNVFSLDSMENLISIAERNAYKPNYLKMPFAIMRAMSESVYKTRTWCWILLCFAIILFSNQAFWWAPWVSIVLVSLPYAYLLLVNRVMDHVESGIWLYAVIFVLFFVCKDIPLETKLSRRFILAINIVCIAGLISTSTFFALDNMNRRGHARKGTSPDWSEFLQYTKKRPNDVFLLPFERYMQLAEYTGLIYESVKPHSLDNLYSTGYWNIHLPPMNHELEKRGVTNIFRDITKDNVYVISDKYSLSFAPFYAEHYHKKLETDTINSFGGIFLLKYRLKEMNDEEPSN